MADTSDTSSCTNRACLDGNCEGCKDGVKFCSDPRCFPRCRDCHRTRHSSLAFIVYFVGLMMALALSYYIYSVYFKDGRQNT